MYQLIPLKEEVGLSEQNSRSSKKEKTPPQRKTTLKWGNDGELSSIDMARIIDVLANKELTQCVLACDANKKSSEILFHLKDRL